MADGTEALFRSIGSGTKTIRPATPPPNVTHTVRTFGSNAGSKTSKRVRIQSPLFSRSNTVESASRAETFVMTQPIDFLQAIEEIPPASPPMASGLVSGQSSQLESFVLYDSTGPHNPLFAPLLASTTNSVALPVQRGELLQTSQTVTKVDRAAGQQAALDQTYVVETPMFKPSPLVDYSSMVDSTSTVLADKTVEEICEEVTETQKQTAELIARAKSRQPSQLRACLDETHVVNTFGDTTKRTGDPPTACPVPLDAEVVQWAREPFVSPFQKKKWVALPADALFNPNDARNEDPDWERAQQIVVRVINEFEGNVELARSHILRLHSEHAERVRPARERMDALAAQLRQLEQKYADWHVVRDSRVKRIRRQKDEKVAAFLAEIKSPMAAAVAKLEADFLK
ncbi:hypothetical protein M3Y99_00427400 [Aphelenchoides fujianensis]|nr:hypothetical protein M3Y99_00427400 [Aphelenchoides fujianensis]